MKLDRKGKSGRLDKKIQYAADIIIVVSVYTILFEMCRLDAEYYLCHFGYWGQFDDMEQLLCAISGVPLLMLLIEMPMFKWMLAFSTVFVLAGRGIYNQQNHLKYIAMVRYGSYRRFYYSLMNRTVFHVLLYGCTGILTTYVLYVCWGNKQVGGVEFLGMCAIYLSQMMLLCMVQTLCMILREGYIVSVLLLLFWFAMVIFGHWIFASGWIWLPANWGMYIRGARMFPGGVPDSAYYIQIGVCVLLWAAVPLVIKRKR